MPRQLFAPVALALALTGCLGRGETETVPLPPEADLTSCPELPPPPCDWSEPTAAPADLAGQGAALKSAWKRLARCAKNAKTARDEWASCPGNTLEEPQ